MRYNPEGEASYTAYPGTYTPDEFTPLVRLKLRIHGTEATAGTDGTERVAGFEVTDEWRVPSLCLSAVTAGRLAVLVDPVDSPDSADPRTLGRVTPLWPRSTLLADTRTSRIVDLEGRLTEVTRYPGRLLRHMRISLDAGGIDMVGDTIDGEPAASGSVAGRWSRRGGVLVRARFLQMSPTLPAPTCSPGRPRPRSSPPTAGNSPWRGAPT
ncbi:hypothetical protein ACIBG6_04465 [Streptomyces sp. NPDC050842]|uniref:hypothetical protein n=1 Tax=Streptomyces sp. NPDC050842 TaxID=3365636 RepID=UPI00378DF208